MTKPQDSGSLRAADLIPLDQVPALLPNRPDRSTVYRWVSAGFAGIRLKTVSVGRTRHTTEDWLLEFFDDIAAARSASVDGALLGKAPKQRTGGEDPHIRTRRILGGHGLTETG